MNEISRAGLKSSNTNVQYSKKHRVESKNLETKTFEWMEIIKQRQTLCSPCIKSEQRFFSPVVSKRYSYFAIVRT